MEIVTAVILTNHIENLDNNIFFQVEPYLLS